MADTVETTETGVTGQVKNDAPTAPVADHTEELERLRREKEQAEMRARQLENEKRDREKADEDARQKQLEEQNEFKTLYERERENRVTLEREKEESAKRSAIDSAKTAILSEYSKEVTDTAEKIGLSLLDDSDTSKEDFKKRLDVLKSQINPVPTKRVVGNNGNIEAPTEDEKEMQKLTRRMRYSDRSVADAARSAALKKIPALDEMRKNAGVSLSEQNSSF